MPTEAAAVSSYRVDVGPLRVAFEQSEMTAGDVARLLGWTRFRYGKRSGETYFDSDRVLRVLGIRACNPGHGYPTQRKSKITAMNALKIGEILGSDPREIGL